MRIRGTFFIGITRAAAAALVVACGGDGYGPSSPDDGGGNRGGGPAGSVTVGSGIQFTSRHNGSANPAVDTIAVGDTMRWTWAGALPHSVRSVGSPSFASSGTLTGSGTYAVQFTAPGTYRYDCVVHGQAMSGTIVVIGDAPRTAQTVTDPTGDLFGSGVPWDLTGLTVARDTGGITVTVELARDVVSPIGGDTTAMLGFVDLDVDQDAATGGEGVVDGFRLDSASTGLGVDYVLQLRRFTADSMVIVTNWDGAIVGWVRPVFDGRRVTTYIPKAIIGGDDGFVNAAVIVGNVHSPTDFAPEHGHLTLGGDAVAATTRVAAATRPAPLTRRAWELR